MGYTYSHDLTTLNGTVSHYDVISALDYNETRTTLIAQLTARMTGSLRARSVYTNVGILPGHEVYKLNDRSQIQYFFSANLGLPVETKIAFDMSIPVRLTGIRMLPVAAYRHTELLFNGFTIWASNSSTNGFDGTWTQIGNQYWRSDNTFRWHGWNMDPGVEYQWYQIRGMAQSWYAGGYYIACACIEWTTTTIPPLPSNRVQYAETALTLNMDDIKNTTKGLVNYWGSASYPWNSPNLNQWKTVLAFHLEEVRQVIDDSYHSSRCYFDCSSTCGRGCSAACTNGCGLGCAASCADGGCINTCSSGCSTSCTYGCSLGCANTCSVNCQTDCASTCYTGCSGICKTSCSGDCLGDYTCANDCQNYCRDGCGSRCGASCTGSCAGACMWGCLNTCDGTCGSSCIGGCGNSCYTTCGNNTCWNNCGMACSVNACSANCTSSCLFNCYNSCSAGCGTNCTTTARVGIHPGF